MAFNIGKQYLDTLDYGERVTVIHSNRKTIAIQIKPDLSITVRAPFLASQKDIERFLREKEGWIQKTLEKLQAKNDLYQAEDLAPLTNAELQDLADRALEYIPKRVAYYAAQMGVTYGRITIRNQKTRWGSCSAIGNLNFNCLLMLTPPDVIDYVVVHELCHRKEMNHSKAFWAEVGKLLPNYKESAAWLKAEGGQIMRRCR